MIRLRRGMASFSAAAMAILAGVGDAQKLAVVRDQRPEDEPCQPGSSDYWDGKAVNRTELKTRKQDQQRFQSKQQAKFNMKGRRK